MTPSDRRRLHALWMVAWIAGMAAIGVGAGLLLGGDALAILLGGVGAVFGNVMAYGGGGD